MSTDAGVGLLHLSDLHLGANLRDEGASDKGSASSLWKKRRLEMQGPDPYVVFGLRTGIKGAARFFGLPEDAFDLHVVTGDISTNATSEERFAFAREYLTGAVVDHSSDAGLHIPKDTLLCVPGNHDKMFETTAARYLSAFGDLPARPPYVAERTARNGRRFVFFAIDSNLYQEGNVAVGKIKPSDLSWLADRFAEAEAAREADPLRLHILLLHHHPADLNRYRRLSFKGFFRGLFEKRFTVLDDGDRLLELCAGHIDVVMHGHEHFPIAFVDKTSGAIVVSAGTSSEWQGKRGGNNFHGLLFDEHTLRIQQFDWRRAQFSPGKAWTFLIPRYRGLLTGSLGAAEKPKVAPR